MPTTQATISLRYAVTHKHARKCDTRCAPPTPVWVAETFIMVGLLLALVGVAGTILGLVTLVGRGVIHAESLAFIGLAGAGAVSIWHGARCNARH